MAGQLSPKPNSRAAGARAPFLGGRYAKVMETVGATVRY